jgi:hypothetical protein
MAAADPAPLPEYSEDGVDLSLIRWMLSLVGGPAAALNGVPINTFDLDAVHSRDPENIARLVPALESLDAVFRVGLIG